MGVPFFHFLTGSAGRAHRFCCGWKPKLERSDNPFANYSAPARTLADFLGHYFPTFFRCFFRLLFRRFSERFWGHFGTLFSLIFHLFFLLKNDSFFYAFWDAFWMDFGGPDPRKWSSRLSETLILTKSPFSSQGGFLMQNGPQNGAQMEPQRH